LPEADALMGEWRQGIDDGLVLLRLLTPRNTVEDVLKAAESRFRSYSQFRLTVYEVEATLPEPEEEEEAAGSASERKNGEKSDRVSFHELIQKLSSGTVANRPYLITVGLASIVAAIGLMRDNVAVIIGAMVIAPLLRPNMALSMATTVGDLKLARRAVLVSLAGIAIALAVAALIGLTVPFDASVEQIRIRTEVQLGDVALALAVGAAGALAFTTGLSEALVGVMVAVALLPPLATAGLLAGAGLWGLAIPAATQVAVNILGIQVAATAVFLLQGIRPRHWWDEDRARKMVRWAGAGWAVLLAALIGLIILLD
jgi:uncharacterized hydrophobic protein (TIGR00341 family)